MYVRKKNKDCSSRSKLAARTHIESWSIASFERGESLPTRKQLAAICKELNSPQLREVGEKEIEYARTHPDVKICYADNTTCWKCHKPMKTVYGLIDECPIPPDAFSDGMIKVCADKGGLYHICRKNARRLAGLLAVHQRHIVPSPIFNPCGGRSRLKTLRGGCSAFHY